MLSGFFDAHSHLTDLRIYDQAQEIITDSILNNIQGTWIGGVNELDWQRQIELKKDTLENFKNKFEVYLSFGLHPQFLADCDNDKELQTRLDQLNQFNLQFHPDGVGETGLDYREKVLNTAKDKEKFEYIQKESFASHIELSLFLKKPLVLHIVQAHEDALRILEGYTDLKGIVHSFMGSKEVATRYLDMGLTLSLSPAVIKPNSRTVQETILWMPEECFVIESDSPDQSPLGYQDLNKPSSILKVADFIGDLRKQNAELILKNTRAKVESLLR
jgi:TatD DNase family protein